MSECAYKVTHKAPKLETFLGNFNAHFWRTPDHSSIVRCVNATPIFKYCLLAQIRSTKSSISDAFRIVISLIPINNIWIKYFVLLSKFKLTWVFLKRKAPKQESIKSRMSGKLLLRFVGPRHFGTCLNMVQNKLWNLTRPDTKTELQWNSSHANKLISQCGDPLCK